MGRDPQPKKPSKSNARSGGKTGAVKPGFDDYTFVRIELNQESKNHYKALLASDEFADFEQLTAYVDGGYKVSFNKDSKGEGIVCSVACYASDDPNCGRILTGRGATATAAWNVFRFKTLYLCEDEIWSTGERAATGDDILR